jgi:hypothetical protein
MAKEQVIDWMSCSKILWQDKKREIISLAMSRPNWQEVNSSLVIPGVWEITKDVDMYYKTLSVDKRKALIQHEKQHAIVQTFNGYRLNPLKLSVVPFMEGFILGVIMQYRNYRNNKQEYAEEFFYITAREVQCLCVVKTWLYKKQPLTCAICGGAATGVQWYNRDQGYGVCVSCAKIYRHKDIMDFYNCYGKEGMHYPYLFRNN